MRIAEARFAACPEPLLPRPRLAPRPKLVAKRALGRRARIVRVAAIVLLVLVTLPCTDHKTEERRAVLAEARYFLLLFSRAASWAFEREQVAECFDADIECLLRWSHDVCLSAAPVPARVPADGEIIMVAESDWTTGDRDSGWKCLRMAGPTDLAVQYSYVKSGPHKASARGGPDPGKEAFEVCAEVDFVQGGETTLLCRQGVIGPRRERIELSVSLEYLEEEL